MNIGKIINWITGYDPNFKPYQPPEQPSELEILIRNVERERTITAENKRRIEDYKLRLSIDPTTPLPTLIDQPVKSIEELRHESDAERSRRRIRDIFGI